jgi:CheY-like chemotaxis protein
VSLKILLADDNMTAQNTGRRILADAGYSVIAVSNGAAALKKFASEHPDILVLDVFMPGYSGLEVCEKLKAESAVPVLLSFSRMEPFRPEDGDRVRADGYVAKPFDATELLEAVARLASALANGQQQSAYANGVAPEITTAEYTETNTPAAPPEPAAEFSIEPAPELSVEPDTLAEEHSAIPEASVAPSVVDREEAEPAKSQPAPTAELNSSRRDSWAIDSTAFQPGALKPGKFEPDGDAAKMESPEKPEARFFSFSSRTLFSAASVERVPAPQKAPERHSSKTESSESAFATDKTGSSTPADSEAAAVAALLSGASTPPPSSEDTASKDAPESWWKSADNGADSDLNAALAAAEASTGTPASDPDSGSKEDAIIHEDVSHEEDIAHEADQPADFHSVLAQLLPSTTTSPSESSSERRSDIEWPISEAIMGFDGEHDIHAGGSETPAPAEPGVSFDSLISGTESEAAEPGVAVEPSASATAAAEKASSPAASERISDAIERALGRFKESLLTEVMRELDPK